MISSGVPSPLLLSETHGCLPANTAPIVYIQQASGDMPFETLETLPRSSLQDYCPRGSSTPPTYLKPICSSIQGGGTAAVHCRELNRASIGHRHFFLSNYDIPSVQCQLIPSICSTDRPVGAMTFDTNPHLLACPGLAPVLSFRKYALLWPPCPSCGRERGGAAPTPSPQLPSDLSSFPAKTSPETQWCLQWESVPQFHLRLIFLDKVRESALWENQGWAASGYLTGRAPALVSRDFSFEHYFVPRFAALERPGSEHGLQAP